MDTYNYTRQISLICPYCQKILRGDEIWELEDKNGEDSALSELSHGICTRCLKENYPRDYLAIQEQRKLKMKNVFKQGYRDLYGHNS